MGFLNFFDRLRGPGASSGDRSPYGEFWFEPASARTGSGMRVSPDSALRLAAVYACVRILAETMASLALRDIVDVDRSPSDGARRREWLDQTCQFPLRYNLAQLIEKHTLSLGLGEKLESAGCKFDLFFLRPAFRPASLS